MNNLQLYNLANHHFNKGITYEAYKNLMEFYKNTSATSGPNQSEALVNYTSLNYSRMNRGDKTVVIPKNIKEAFNNIAVPQKWLVITESWCGDAAQTLPAIAALAYLSNNINLKLVFRDENHQLMDAFLTQGARSIPKLIALQPFNKNIKFVWGPRPTEAKKLVEDYKNEFGKITDDLKTKLQVWYNKDKYQNTINDISALAL